MLNGDHRVAFDRKFVAGRIVRNNGVTIRIDLGARFGVDRIAFYPRMTELFPFENEFMRGYELFLNDGLLPKSLCQWTAHVHLAGAARSRTTARPEWTYRSTPNLSAFCNSSRFLPSDLKLTR